MCRVKVVGEIYKPLIKNKMEKIEIASYESAAGYIGYNAEDMPIVNHLPEIRQKRIIADHKVDIIIEAVNKKFNDGETCVFDYANSHQDKWYIWWDFDSSGFRFSVTYYVLARTHSAVGPRLSFVSRAAAEHFGKHQPFAKLWNQMNKI